MLFLAQVYILVVVAMSPSTGPTKLLLGPVEYATRETCETRGREATTGVVLPPKTTAQYTCSLKD